MTTEINGINKKPTFLKVLCILSFIGCGINILIDLFAIVLSSIADSRSADQIDRNNPLDQVMFFMANSRGTHIKELIAEIASLAGVILMWRMKKIGFIFYLIGEGFIYIEFIYLVVSTNPGLRDATGLGIEMLWPLPFDLAFIIMYATQLKFMSWNFRGAAGI